MSVAFITGKRQASHMQYGELAAVLHLSSISTKGLSQQKEESLSLVLANGRLSDIVSRR